VYWFNVKIAHDRNLSGEELKKMDEQAAKDKKKSASQKKKEVKKK
jgi:hypothetical protein